MKEFAEQSRYTKSEQGIDAAEHMENEAGGLALGVDYDAGPLALTGEVPSEKEKDVSDEEEVDDSMTMKENVQISALVSISAYPASFIPWDRKLLCPICWILCLELTS